MSILIRSIRGQFCAALTTLKQCIDNCPADQWNKSHNDAPFSQVLFHTLFYADYYLSQDEQTFKEQPFHTEHPALFAAYEEFIDKKTETVYTKEEIEEYFHYCSKKLEYTVDSLTEKDVYEKSTLKNMTVMEVYIYNIRHIQHHAAQLGLRIQQINGTTLQWISSGST
ncbi:hypothetical protein PilKf_01576 [Pillotina sp. SPG140]|jgi:hypothetical protein